MTTSAQPTDLTRGVTFESTSDRTTIVPYTDPYFSPRMIPNKYTPFVYSAQAITPPPPNTKKFIPLLPIVTSSLRLSHVSSPVSSLTTSLDPNSAPTSEL